MPEANAPIRDDAFEREKFEFEKQRSLEEAKRLSEELAIKKRESERSRWTNPFVVAIIGATAVGLFNVGAIVLNATYQRDLLERTNQNLASVESVKAQNATITEVIKLGDPQKIRDGLCVLLKLNSISNPTLNSAMQSYVDEHSGCTVAVVPVSGHSTGDQKPPEDRSKLVHASALVLGCGNSGCNEPNIVCGNIPQGMKATGEIVNSVDSFNGAWGGWIDPPTITGDKVCRTFLQHSHNVNRNVAYDFRVVPIS